MKDNMNSLYKSEAFINLCGAHNLGIINEDIEEMKEYRLIILNGTIDEECGLCNGLFYNLNFKLTPEEFYPFFRGYSGNSSYPIEGDWRAYNKLYNVNNRYNLKTRYGRQRLKLLEFIIKVYERAIKVIKANSL